MCWIADRPIARLSLGQGLAQALRVSGTDGLLVGHLCEAAGLAGRLSNSTTIRSTACSCLHMRGHQVSCIVAAAG